MKWLESLVNDFDNLQREEIKRILINELDSLKKDNRITKQFDVKARKLFMKG